MQKDEEEMILFIDEDPEGDLCKMLDQLFSSDEAIEILNKEWIYEEKQEDSGSEECP